jgi:hypothetical protein
VSDTRAAEWFVAMVDKGHDPVLEVNVDLDCSSISAISRCYDEWEYEARETV